VTALRKTTHTLDGLIKAVGGMQGKNKPTGTPAAGQKKVNS
jgi:hypothetical protein